MELLSVARRAKHLGFVANKRSRRWARKTKFEVATVAFRDADRFRPFVYRPDRYADTFLSHDVRTDGDSEFPRRVFAVWTGDNEMSPNRMANLGRIRQQIGLPLELVTSDSLDTWLVPGHPLHGSYRDLSLIHRSDYLRGYLMHHHGGAYVDIKQPLGSWLPSYEQMAADPDIWVTSYSSSHANWIGKLRGRLGRDILLHYREMFGKSGFMMRSHTPLTAAWMAQMHHILDEKAAQIAAQPGGVYGAEGYPLSWTDLLARVLDPLTLKYLAHVRCDDRMLLHFEDYR
ncbi:hypothetical protein [Nocardioides currus]|uniref:Uncharacterized protein n=1 Tax=Nocardioides currus TaxID=2133958 RepID=A0A2R7YYS8_9ACTN|nr:hypothetical protein [Nocardioides currus]PUA81530.1 hypothetical protein C7S10_05470 [Nocardioides currus]